MDNKLKNLFEYFAAACFLNQISQDSFKGNNRYYQTQMGIANSKERILGYGAGLA